MTWIIYTRLTAQNRAAEAMVALFCLFWAAYVQSCLNAGSGPLDWAAVPRAEQWQYPAALAVSGLLHMAGMATARPHPLPPLMRAAAMGGMAATFAALSWAGAGQSALPTYAGLSLACLGGVVVALRDVRYAREVRNAA